MTGKFRGHYYQQMNHQRLSLVMQGMPAVEAGVLFKLYVLAGIARQQFDLCDGRFSLSGRPMHKDEVAAWISAGSPGLSVKRASEALDALSLYKELSISKAGVVRLACWCVEQQESPTYGAEKRKRNRLIQWTEAARDSLRLVDGQVLEADALLYRVQGAAKVGAKSAEVILQELSGSGELVPHDGGLRVCVMPAKANGTAPAALPPPHESEGRVASESEGDISHFDKWDMSPSLNHIHKRDVNTSHDHDRRACTRPNEVSDSPSSSLRSEPGPESVKMIGGGGSAAGAERGGTTRSGVRVDLFSIPDVELVDAALRFCNPSEFAKSKGILTSKLMGLRRVFGPQKARQIFCEEASAVQTDVLCPGQRALREPARELCARLNERQGNPRRMEGNNR